MKRMSRKNGGWGSCGMILRMTVDFPLRSFLLLLFLEMWENLL